MQALADADAAEKADEARAAAETAAAAEAERHAVAEAALAAQLSALRRQLDSLRAENVRHADALHALRNDTDAEVWRGRRAGDDGVRQSRGRSTSWATTKCAKMRSKQFAG